MSCRPPTSGVTITNGWTQKRPAGWGYAEVKQSFWVKLLEISPTPNRFPRRAIQPGYSQVTLLGATLCRTLPRIPTF